ncbi:MAG: type II toxin-antitoxin system VapC family toxin [Sulfurimicrobium sp.]|nr:type II toxin-antitoxin system VapC family toxin [Sulfurimicrobium sp.]MDP1703407.1 type II toxin-antitoxin system VapC family toxin [Sulfurimicrobium sp.]MDP2198413.1 type II toxin-antitoxin system VapC family toxin [Sulfurimicrobium sp.]MDP2961176.1 type II toxin-antitoxin system VapC family toxin [Sulfurimicrobium sp.]MDP3689224.1 type II toxin-antitoxin system VapC family toxin [Sulfurimicrobium sp.]
MPFVVDNSVVVGWYFESQATPYTDQALDLLANETAHVPALWVLEFSNVLRKALKAGKADTARIQEIIELVKALPISVDYTSESVESNLALALKYGLTSYDAAYLGLAMRLQLPIATNDGALKEAAGRASVGIVNL